MIEGILPDLVSCVSTRSDEVPPDVLFPEEAEIVRDAVPKRRREFSAVRRCARQAMAGLGLPPVAVLPGPRGEPLWPGGIVGSMTHCAGYYAAAVARTRDFHTLGIDAEPHAPLPGGVLEAIVLPAEERRLAGLGTRDGIHWDRLLFSAKESIFKAWYPVSHVKLDFSDADITFRRDSTFTVQLLRQVPTAPAEFEGRWSVRNGFVLTAIAISTILKVGGSL